MCRVVSRVPERMPSIKGTAFQAVPQDLLGLVESGGLSREELETRLEALDLELLEAKIQPASWYPIATYARMVELLADCGAPNERERYCVERGRRAAQRLADAGIYQQLHASSEQLGARIGHFSITLGQQMYSFGRWRYEPGREVGGFGIELEDVADLPEVARWATQGFIELAASRIAGFPMRVESERAQRDRVVFRGQRLR
jgi:hypothetical protein